MALFEFKYRQVLIKKKLRLGVLKQRTVTSKEGNDLDYIYIEHRTLLQHIEVKQTIWDKTVFKSFSFEFRQWVIC